MHHHVFSVRSAFWAVRESTNPMTKSDLAAPFQFSGPCRPDCAGVFNSLYIPEGIPVDLWTDSMKTTQKCYRIDRREIAFLKFILEAYEGIATLTTLDPQQGTVRIAVAPGCEPVVQMLLNDLRKDMLIERIPELSTGSGADAGHS